MARYFLGVDVGGTKTHALIADEAGQCLGFGAGGPGNPNEVGYPALVAALRQAVGGALTAAGLTSVDVVGAGFGVSGLDWPAEEEAIRQAIQTLGLQVPFALVNDTVVGLLAGSAEGWGVAVVAGTGCNCWGWDRTRQRIGRVTGYGLWAGEAAGAGELVQRALQSVAHAWTQRDQPTALTAAFLEYTGIRTVAELLEKVFTGQVELDAPAAPLVFQVAAAGDAVAREVVRWAGRELGEMANAVIRQLEFESLAFDVVLVGGMYEGGPLLLEPLRETVRALAPAARFVRLNTLPVVGAVLLGMEQVGIAAPEKREVLIRSCPRG